MQFRVQEEVISSIFNLQLQLICSCNSWARPSSCVRQGDRTGRKFLEYWGLLTLVRNTPFCCHLNQSEKCIFALKEEEDRECFYEKVHQCISPNSAPVEKSVPVHNSVPVHKSAPVHNSAIVNNCAPVHDSAPEEHLCTSRGSVVHFRAERLKSSTSGKIAMFCRLLHFCLTYFHSRMIVMSPYMHNAWCYKLQKRNWLFIQPSSTDFKFGWLLLPWARRGSTKPLFKSMKVINQYKTVLQMV